MYTQVYINQKNHHEKNDVIEILEFVPDAEDEKQSR